jgi:hypothetical protein
MALDIEARVYVYGDDDNYAPCMWFGKCPYPANGLRNGPIGNGLFGPIPICKRCDDKCERLSAPHII